MENNILFGYEIAYISMNFTVIQIFIIKELVLFYFI